MSVIECSFTSGFLHISLVLRRGLSLIAIGAILTLNVGFSQCPIDIGTNTVPTNNGLLVHFPFDGNLINYGYASHTITLYGAVYDTGICGQGLKFDGIDDYGVISPSIDLDNTFTITCWVKLDDTTKHMGLFSVRNQCSNTFRGWSKAECSIYGNNIPGLSYMVNRTLDCTTGSAGDRYWPAVPFPHQEFAFLAFIVQNNSTESRVVRSFLNCEELYTPQLMDYTTAFVFTSGLTFTTTLGANSTIPAFMSSLDGVIDDFRIYDRVLSPQELKELYYACRPISFEMNLYTTCHGDSTEMVLGNTEVDVEYALVDLLSNQVIGQVQQGNCDSLVFTTGWVADSLCYGIRATHVISACSLMLDTMICLEPIHWSYLTTDTSLLCPGDSVVINGVTYTQPVIISDSFLTSAGCDSVHVYFVDTITIPVILLGQDTILCPGETLILESGIVHGTVTWNTGHIGNQLMVDQAGWYWCEYTIDACSLTISDTIYVHYGGAMIMHDTTICKGEYLEIGGQIIQDPGQHLIELIDEFGCDSIINLQLGVVDLPFVYLGRDTTICIGEAIELDAGVGASSFEWSNGSNEQRISISKEGLYWVLGMNQCGICCDSIFISLEDCESFIFIPNAFTPNHDGMNDFFEIFGKNILSFNLMIFNRWGEMLLETNEISKWWDGTYKGKDCPSGVYVYRIKFLSRNAMKEEFRTGRIVILK